VTTEGVRIVAEWYAGLSDVEKARFQARVWYLLQQVRDDWTRPQFDTLSNDATGFGEIRMKKVNGVETRLIGYFGGGSFYVVVITSKKGEKYNPSNWISLAKQRRAEIQNDPRRANEWIPQEPVGKPEE